MLDSNSHSISEEEFPLFNLLFAYLYFVETCATFGARKNKHFDSSIVAISMRYFLSNFFFFFLIFLLRLYKRFGSTKDLVPFDSVMDSEFTLKYLSPVFIIVHNWVACLIVVN